MKEVTDDPDFVVWNKGMTIQEMTGNPDWVNWKKGKTMQEITGNPDYVRPTVRYKIVNGKRVYYKKV